MSNLDKYFKGQQEREELICFFRQHWIVMFRELIVFVLFICLWTVAMFYMKEIQNFLKNVPSTETIFAIVFVVSTAYVHYFFLKVLNHFVRIGIITNIRLIDHKKTLYFLDTMETTDLNNIQDMEQVIEGLLPNILSYGDLKIYLTASSSIKTFYKVPNPQFHFRCVSRQKEARQKIFRDRMHSEINYIVEPLENNVDSKKNTIYTQILNR